MIRYGLVLLADDRHVQMHLHRSMCRGSLNFGPLSGSSSFRDTTRGIDRIRLAEGSGDSWYSGVLKGHGMLQALRAGACSDAQCLNLVPLAGAQELIGSGSKDPARWQSALSLSKFTEVRRA